ncbi:MAG: ABC transporter permease subunit [Lachnospiraceae bacterium]|nr:ABC transporter permease subunit [Lachnospiraceae bacterium]
MIAVWKRELKSFFDDMLGYFIVAAFLMLIGYFFSEYNIENPYAFFAYPICAVSTFMSALIPLLTMRSFSEERKSKTDQLLLTAPVSVWKITMGKYLAMVSVFAIPVLISCVYPIVIYVTGSYAYPLTDYTTILAFFLVGASYIAIGMFFSSLTESQIIAALLAFAFMFILGNLRSLATKVPMEEWKNAVILILFTVVFFVIFFKMTQNFYVSFAVFAVLCIGVAVAYHLNPDMFYGVVGQIMRAVSYGETLYLFANNIFDVTSIVLYLSVSAFFIFLTIQSIQKRRYS